MPSDLPSSPFRQKAVSLVAALFAVCAAGSEAARAQAPVLALRNAQPQIMFDAYRDHCAPIDTPDMPPRAFRDATGGLNMFTLHYINRALRGPDLAHLKIDCNVALNSGLDADPSKYNDRRYLAATWTTDGSTVIGVLHHEYHSDEHRRCAVQSALGCWYNSLIAVTSTDGGRNFDLAKQPVVASAPFRANAEEGRHRGFFNPSNIVSDGRYFYLMSATTGWGGQNYGVCLFRSTDPRDASLWRAWDGKAFSIQYRDPYAPGFVAPKPCAIIEPFLFAVGGIVRHRASGHWVAVWMAKAGPAQFPVSGVYYATSADLKSWSQPHLLRIQKSLFDDVCEGTIGAYPALIDETATGRNFDDAGNEPWLYYASITMSKCQTANRLLVRERVSLTVPATKAPTR